ncbi:MAG: hypothetical protein LBU76_04205 [Azoarcus sp.]|nr:hypothetical protein [Azoarcus sp.]
MLHEPVLLDGDGASIWAGKLKIPNLSSQKSYLTNMIFGLECVNVKPITKENDMPKIYVSDVTFQRLKERVTGFNDTPEAVIERLLDDASAPQPVCKTPKPELIFRPADEGEFKRLLIQRRRATVVLYKGDGTNETLKWTAKRIKPESDLRGNIWSGYLRGWESKGIVRAEFSV